MEASKRSGYVAGCPWCGNGHPLCVKGDGFGSVALSCEKCGCRGPEVQVEGEFSEADELAIARWSDRSCIRADTLQRLTAAVNLAALMNNGRLELETDVLVHFADLRELIRACKPNWTRDFPAQGVSEFRAPAVGASSAA